MTSLKIAEEVMYITQTNIIYNWQYTVPYHPYSTAAIQRIQYLPTQTHMYIVQYDHREEIMFCLCECGSIPTGVFFLKAAQQFLLPRSVTDLARLSLEQPVFVSVHENASHTTPDTLTQSYIVTDLQHKVNISRKVTYV